MPADWDAFQYGSFYFVEYLDESSVIRVLWKYGIIQSYKAVVMMGLVFGFYFDIINGAETIFPIPLAQGCTFSPEMNRKLY